MKLAAEFDTPGKQREIFERWFVEYEKSSHATEPEPETHEDQAEVSAAIAASLGLGPAAGERP